MHGKTEVVGLVYDELAAMARAKLAREAAAGEFQTRDLVHEAYLRLVKSPADDERARWENRRHFYGAAAEAMRRVLIDDARRRHAPKHGGGWRRVPLHHAERIGGADGADVLSLHDTLEALETVDRRAHDVAQLRYFGGLTVDEVAETLGIAPRTAKKDWAFAKAWLHKHLRENDTQQR